MRRMTPREAINIFKERIILAEHNRYADEIADYIKAMKMAIIALKKLEKDSDKSCETCKHENEYGAKSPCRGCYMGTKYEDRYEPYTAEDEE